MRSIPRCCGCCLVLILILILTAAPAHSAEVQLAAQPNLSSDGSTLLFVYAGDIWRVSTDGGKAVRLTLHPSAESRPHFSPDEKQIAFVSGRSGSQQIHVMPADGGKPEQRTYHTEGHTLQGWFPDGERFLTLATRDHFWRSAQRFFSISAKQRSAEKLLFDGY